MFAHSDTRSVYVVIDLGESGPSGDDILDTASGDIALLLPSMPSALGILCSSRGMSLGADILYLHTHRQPSIHSGTRAIYCSGCLGALGILSSSR